MPRSFLLEENRLKAKAEKTGHNIKVQIIAAEADGNKARSETIKHSGMSQASFYKAWNDPSLFRVGQLIRIYDFLKVPEEERRFV